jgi:two-component system response regulator HydG
MRPARTADEESMAEETSAPAFTVLLVDDDASHLDALERIFQKEGLRTLTAPGGTAALDILRREPVSVVLTDLSMPDLSGLELLKAAKAIQPGVEVILMTAYGTVEVAVDAMKEGAYDFVTKPFKRHHVVAIVHKALEKQALVRENQVLRARLEGLGRIIGSAPAFRATMDLVRQAAPSDARVLLLGESGTGKELVARLIHSLSPRASSDFVAINCAAIPESLLEGELFGAEKGAYTGAVARKVGRLERAHGGTLFLDEIGELTPAVQVKLLRVLQEGEFERLGGHGPIKVDARIVAATNKHLEELVEKGLFREDLYYRLSVIPIRLPPLRSRREDIGLLAQHFLRLYADKNRKNVVGISRAGLDLLEGYAWPGNVRELQHAMERAVVLARGDVLGPDDFEPKVRGGTRAETGTDLSFRVGSVTLEEVEDRLIRETLRLTKDDKTLAANLLGISARTIYRKLDGPAKG